MICTWGQLAQLRANGRRPALPVFVTTREWYARRLIGVGAMTIIHKPGEPMPVELLEGLEVILALESCEQASAVWKLMKRRESFPARCESWCWCDQSLTVSVGPCADLKAIDEALAA